VKRLNVSWLPIALAAACGGGGTGYPNAAAGLKLVTNASRGNILVDDNGRTLYSFAQDVPGANAVSKCTGSSADAGSCVHLWPVFHVDSPTLGAGLNAADVAQVRRADGSLQTTYKGYLLYYFLPDANPGDVNGEAIPEWFVLRDPFYNVMQLDGAGDRLADGTGRTLYVFDRDTDGAQPVSACAGTAGDRTSCVGNFPPFFAGDDLVAPRGLDAEKFTTFTRADNQKQTAYNGRPLYRFADDAVPGDLKGLAFAPGLGHWFTLNPAQP
jgi:predicted lipoprotein with Yx(FWY)xxD motif